MTLNPEVQLAREFEICYATIAVVSNKAAGMGEETRVDTIKLSLKKSEEKLHLLINNFLPKLNYERNCVCSKALKNSRI